MIDYYYHPNLYILFPGSFNPAHEGHFFMAKEVEKITGMKVVFNITRHHPDKGDLTDEEISKRFQPILDQGFCVLKTEQGNLYIDKSNQFSNYKMIVGLDALRSMFDPKYGIEQEVLLKTFIKNNTQLIIFDRNDNNAYSFIDDLLIYNISIRNIVAAGQAKNGRSLFYFAGVAPNISSTEIRMKEIQQ